MSNRNRCWTWTVVLSFLLPVVIWAAVKITATYMPFAAHGLIEQRYLLAIVPGLAVEWLFTLAVWLWLSRQGESFSSLGVWNKGTLLSWSLALACAALSILANTRTLQRMHVPPFVIFHPTGFHLYAALAMGITAGFCEELLFRAFLMSEFARAGYSKVFQVIVPGLAFGVAHVGYSSQGILVALGIMIPTALLGMMWGVAYLLGRRSLLPCVVAHFFNDATAIPWIVFVIMTFGPK